MNCNRKNCSHAEGLHGPSGCNGIRYEFFDVPIPCSCMRFLGKRRKDDRRKQRVG